jgi:hypothetical protein
MDIRIVGAQQRIDNLEAKAKTEPISLDPELQSQIARFMCVLSSGLIEQALIQILSAYARKRSSQNVARYVAANVARLRNAKFEDVLVILSHFSSDWREHFEISTPIDVKDAIDSIVNNRNQIAHGGQVGISLATFMGYYKRVKSFIADLDAFVSVQ